ncbi:PREDICTED: signal peptide peptidase-like 2A [Nanorana parkeri]|uniref:signal peptide peptidase-like 2A n=1 Tax=Nanorana parkeri TaxID=125878 RepID=UPI0008540026|nr:PREDICTED: signal peptide peptidase-like 2A [Nanorana parkeri]
MGPTGLLGLLLLLHWPQIYASKGILRSVVIGDPPRAKDYCITYNSTWTTLPPTYTNATFYRLLNLSSVWLCSPSDVPSKGFQDMAVIVMDGNCSILEKAILAENNNAKMLLLASKEGLPAPQDSKINQLTIPLAYVKYKDLINMEQVLGNNIAVTLYSPTLTQFDFSLLIIFLISVFTVALGGYWSGLSEMEDLRPSPSEDEYEGRKKKDENVTFTPLTVILFVVICCVMLLLLYFFYKWLVYVIICVFCLASAMSLFNCLSALIRNIPYGRCRISCVNKSAEVRLLFLAAFCVAVSVTWAVFRNEDRWIWILQDILGIAFCLNFIKTLRMPNFKACVILLGLLLVYDVFFVFITPFFTKVSEQLVGILLASGVSVGAEKNGESYVEVPAESQATYEKLPVVIRVPRLQYSAVTLCEIPMSLLGFGDIIVPGLLVAYCKRFDVRTASSSIYYISCTIAYAVGMVLTFIILMVMKMGQPALLYLVPCTLLTSSVIAWRRKEMKKFWNGGSYEIMEQTDNAVNEENIITGETQEAP